MFPEKEHLKVLLVDDEPSIISAMTAVLRAFNYTRLTAAGDGLQALRLVEQSAFDLIITDLDMPKMQGDDLIAAVNELRPGTEAMVISGVISNDRERRLHDLGVRVCLSKPFRLPDILIPVDAFFARLAAETLARAEEALRPLVEAYEKVDTFADGHSRRVADIAVDLALELDMSLGQMVHLWIAGLGHDVGMSRIDPGILLKPGALTDAEFESIKTHPRWSGEMVSQIVPAESRTYITGHHENLDGSGYPRGLGRQVTLGAQIISISDAYAAMHEPRPFRGPRDEGQIRSALLEGSGARWAPELVKALVDFRLAT